MFAIPNKDVCFKGLLKISLSNFENQVWELKRGNLTCGFQCHSGPGERGVTASGRGLANQRGWVGVGAWREVRGQCLGSKEGGF